MKYNFQNSINMLTSSISQGIENILEKKFKEGGFKTTPIEWITLSFLSRQEYYTQNELALLIGKNKVYVKRLIDELENQKLVKRQILGRDKRHNKVVITQKGIEKYKILLPIIESTLDEVFHDFNEIEVNTLLRLLKNVSKNIH